MTKQSSVYKTCADGAALLTGLPRYARNDKRARAQSAGDTYECAIRRTSIIYALLSILYLSAKGWAWL